MEGTLIRRSELGYRVGEDHHRAKVPDAVVRRARDLRDEGLKLAAISLQLWTEFGFKVTLRTVKAWCLFDRRNVTPREREDRMPAHRTPK